MNIHEYQAKELFRSYGIPVPDGRVAEHASEAAAAARELGPDVVIKAQIHAGGRGRAGGVKPASPPEEAERIAASLLGRALITGQTGPEGRMVRAVLVERGQKIARELYAAVTLDRAAGRPVLMASPDGGMDIEAVAADTPERLIRVMADPLYGLTDFEARRAAAFLGFTGRDLHACARLLKNLFRLYAEKDASLAEINPLIVTEDGDILALDAKLNFEDNALFRHPELAGLADAGERDPLELEAERHGLNYIRLDGNVGVMVNGAGLAMATMDLIKQAGGDPANFLDVGGGAGAALLCGLCFGLPPAGIAGLFGGALTSTPALATAMDGLDPAGTVLLTASYGLAYPAGIIGVIVFVRIAARLEGVDVKAEEDALNAQDADPLPARKDGGANPRGTPAPSAGTSPLPVLLVIGAGYALGQLPLPLPGQSSVSLGSAGGILLCAILAAGKGHAGKLPLLPSPQMRLFLRDFGLYAFLAGVGVQTGALLDAETLRSGMPVLAASLLTVSLPMLVCRMLCRRVFHIDFLTMLGIVTGSMTSTPGLAAASSVSPHRAVVQAYAAVYPLALLCMIFMIKIMHIVIAPLMG